MTWFIHEKRSDRNGHPFLLLRGTLEELEAATADDAVRVWEHYHGPASRGSYGYVAEELVPRRTSGTLPQPTDGA
jgi:hypothetical protein